MINVKTSVSPPNHRVQMSIQKCMSGLYPSEGLAYDSPISERKVYDALEKALPKNWYGWHSLKVRTERFGMADECFSFYFTDALGSDLSREFEKRCSKFLLEKPYRCPEEIQAMADAYCGKEREEEPGLFQRAATIGFHCSERKSRNLRMSRGYLIQYMVDNK